MRKNTDSLDQTKLEKARYSFEALKVSTFMIYDIYIEDDAAVVK